MRGKLSSCTVCKKIKNIFLCTITTTYYILYLFLTVLDKHLLEYSFGLLIYPILFIFYLFSRCPLKSLFFYVLQLRQLGPNRAKTKKFGESEARSSENTKENNLLGSRIKINKFLEGKSETEIKNYIEQFFVGLLEGDGTITVDFVNNCKKRVRIFIALNNLEDNRFMLSLIAKYVGRVVIERNNRYVTWYATSRTDIAKVFAILAKYPLLSTRKLCQLDFAKDFIDSNQDISEQEFIKLRNEKYKNQERMLDYNDKNFVIPSYFPAWLSGFIEAEGHFKLVKRANNSIHVSQFIIGQNYEKHLLKAILTYFNKENNKRSFTLSKEGVIYYKIYIGGSEVRNLLASHFYSYPLLGDKNTKYQEWVNKH